MKTEGNPSLQHRSQSEGEIKRNANHHSEKESLDLFNFLEDMVLIDSPKDSRTKSSSVSKKDSPKESEKSPNQDNKAVSPSIRVKNAPSVHIEDFLKQSVEDYSVGSPKANQQKEYELSNTPQNFPFPTKGRIVTFGVNSFGTTVALGGKQLIFVDLKNGKEVFKTSPGNFDFSVAEWSHVQTELLASACSTESTVWKFDQGTGKVSILAKLPFHKRAVADIDWNYLESDILSTCAADGCVAIWDLREPRRPSTVFKTLSASPVKVQWNRFLSETLATANGGEIKIWDSRNESGPVETILAHASPINGMDWNPRNKYEILSYSQDRTVKFWSTESKSEPRAVLNVGAPIASASYAPFGRAVSTVSKGENIVKLWNLSDVTFPVFTFSGAETLSRFQWVSNTDEDGSKSFQIAAISKDHSLKVWKVGKYAQKVCKGIPPPIQQRPTDAGILDLSQEYALLIRHGITGVTIVELNLEQRWCKVSAKTNDKKTLDLQINFPLHYPHGASPSFHPLPSSTLPISILTNLRKILTDTAAQLTSRHRPCLEECLSKMVLLLKTRSVESLSDAKKEGEERKEAEIPQGIIAYVVKPTDTLSGIALTHNMSREHVRQANQLFSTQLIPGTILYLKDPNCKSLNLTPNQILDFKKLRTRRSTVGSSTGHNNLISSAPVTESEITESEKKEVEPEPRKSLDAYSFGQLQGRLQKAKSEDKEEIVREQGRYCSDDFNVEGILTLTSTMLIFEPNLESDFVLKNGVLPYQLVIQMKNIFDTQIIGEDSRYMYDDSLEISVLDQDQVRIYDFLVNPKKLNSIYKKIIQCTSTQTQNENTQILLRSKDTKEHKSGFVPSLDKESVLLTESHREQLSRRLPGRYRYNDWKLAYSTQVHGISLKTFFTRTENAGANIIVIEDSKGYVFGAYASEGWKVEPRFYGNGESFVFQLKPSIEVYDWSEKNSNFMCSRRDFIAMGGGPMFSLWLDSELNNGSSNACETFNSPILSSSEDFQIAVVEVWSVSNSL